MAIIKTKNSYIERNNFDYVQAYAESQSSNAVVVSELVQMYVLIAQNMSITPAALIQQIKSGTISPIMLAAQLNSVRTRNALIGVASNQGTPVFIAREIAA
jgi:hypothetical protein